VLTRQVEAKIESGVIPIRPMVSAPSAGLVHPGDVATNLAAAVAVSDDIAVDSGSVRLKTARACFSMISVSERRGAESQQ
jgi:hypothetical protein